LITGIQGLATSQACLTKLANPVATGSWNRYSGPASRRKKRFISCCGKR
jgi:hypothetical protein